MELKNYVVFKVDQADYGYLIVKEQLSTPEFADRTSEILASQLTNSYFNDDLNYVINNPTIIIAQSDTFITEKTHPELFV